MSVAFLLTSLIIVVTPGTGALYTIAAGMSRGARASLIAHGGAAARKRTGLRDGQDPGCGLPAVHGLGHLAGQERTSVEADAAPKSARRVVTSAVLINLLNPKLTIFFFAFLPQFVPSNSPHALARLLALSALFMLMTFVVFALYGVFAAWVRTHLIARPRIVEQLRRFFAASFVAFGAKLFTSART